MLMSDSGTVEFSKWRAYLWPIHRHELRKLVPMLLIFFLITFAYNVLHIMKDTLVVTAKNSGAEAIPFIKGWAMFPGAILMTFAFTRLSNRYSRDTVTYVIVTLFLGYFFLFAFILYPARHSLHPNEFADYLQTILPAGFKGIIAMFRNWTFTLFYVMAELWSNIIVSLVCWGFANQTTLLGEAKRFYGVFGIGINVSGIAAGEATKYFSRTVYNPSLPFGEDAWSQSMTILLSCVIIAGIGSLLLFRWLSKHVLNDTSYSGAAAAIENAKVKNKLSLRDSFAYLMRSRYLISIAVIVVAYNIVINLVEVLWKHQVRELYPDSNDFNYYMGSVKTWIGILATASALFISGNSIRKFGWTFTAMITPGILFITSVGFFGFFFLQNTDISSILALFSMSPLALVVFFGSAQNVLSRAAKYTVFDSTKEMAFVPLSPESKLKGKAAIDGVCSRLGKSGGSVIHQSLLVIFSTFSASAPYVAAALFAMIIVWMAAIRVLGKKFNEITEQTPAPAPIKGDLVENPA